MKLEDVEVPVHANDKALLFGDFCWLLWNLYGLYIGVPLVWGLISLVANFFSVLLILSKYQDKTWLTKEIQ